MSIKRIKKSSNLQNVPDDCLEIIVYYLGDDIEYVNNFELVCKEFRYVVNNLYERHFDKKLYSNIKEFMKSDQFVIYNGQQDYVNLISNILYEMAWSLNDNPQYIYYYNFDSTWKAEELHYKDNTTTIGIFKHEGQYYYHRDNYICVIDDRGYPNVDRSTNEYKSVMSTTLFRRLVQQIKGEFFLCKPKCNW